ncbi:hypothetical protein [Paludisphaera rhizosphaerae]|uniref:hypothetical protein n=1 Tax=Paludisphaera rhizosphaerae TaxID=2711216 RepID=UPI0013ED986B|nr:hypothetical protein [Paludisphaera rhizosphaerae]
MPRPDRYTWRAIRIPYRTIRRVYGSDNLDDAGDDLVYALRIVSEYPNQFRHRFSTDSSHDNPWYHELIFEIEGIPEPTYDRFVEEIAALGLLETPRTS